MNKYIKSPTNYIGGKYKLLPQIMPYFPKNIDTFVDLFSGGANVGINVDAKLVVFNDINKKINGLFKWLNGKDPKIVVDQINSMIDQYGLSETNKDGFLKLRKDYNDQPTPLKLYTLVSYSFNYQFRFNDQGKFNGSFGKNRSRFTKNMKSHLVQFMSRLNNINAVFTTKSFDDLQVTKLSPKSFVYVDPPYLLADAAYNKRWSKDHEIRLYHLLDKLNSHHIKFALSNVLVHQGKTNKLLKHWVDKHGYVINTMNYSYTNSSYHRRRLPSQEVLVTNYQKDSKIDPNNKINLLHGDCLKLMNRIPNKSVDLILADLPYGNTIAKWDRVLPSNKLWKQYCRLIKDHGAIVLFGAEPFSTKLRNSNLRMYRYDWIWHKTSPTCFIQSHHMPLHAYENIMVFYKHRSKYNPQFTNGKPYKWTSHSKYHHENRDHAFFTHPVKNVQTINSTGSRFPTNVITFSNGNHNRYHPTQKPTDLLRYLIKTYTDKNDLVLDNVMGSGSTGVAAKQLNRRFIGIELNDNYFKVAKKRIDNVSNQKLVTE